MSNNKQLKLVLVLALVIVFALTSLTACQLLELLGHSHKLVHHEKVDASCTQDGSIEYWSCEDCGKLFGDEACTQEVTSIVISATGHTPATAIHENVQNATCLAEGSFDEVVKCSVCQEELSRTHKTNQKLPHSPVLQSGSNATCPQVGYKDYYKCSGCNQFFADSSCLTLIDDLDAWKAGEGKVITHVFDQEVADSKYLVSEASHSANAVYCKSCSCGEKGSETFELAGSKIAHTFDQEIADSKYLVSEASHSANAVYYKSCSCGEKGSETFELAGSMIAHTFDQEVVDSKYLVSAATCEAKAVYHKSCTCGAIGEQTFETGSELGHNYASIKVTSQPTTTEYYKTNTFDTTGMVVVKCCDRSGCGHEETITDYTVQYQGSGATSFGANDTKVTLVWNGLTTDVAITVKKVTITFNLNGGKLVVGQSEITSMDVDYGTCATTLSQFEAGVSRQGYDFAGWFVGDHELGAEDFVNGPVTIDLHWTIKKFDLTWLKADGTELRKDTNVEYGTTISAPAIPEKTEDYVVYTSGWDKTIPQTCTESATYKVVYTATNYTAINGLIDLSKVSGIAVTLSNGNASAEIATVDGVKALHITLVGSCSATIKLGNFALANGQKLVARTKVITGTNDNQNVWYAASGSQLKSTYNAFNNEENNVSVNGCWLDFSYTATADTVIGSYKVENWKVGATLELYIDCFEIASKMGDNGNTMNFETMDRLPVGYVTKGWNIHQFGAVLAESSIDGKQALKINFTRDQGYDGISLNFNNMHLEKGSMVTVTYALTKGAAGGFNAIQKQGVSGAKYLTDVAVGSTYKTVTYTVGDGGVNMNGIYLDFWGNVTEGELWIKSIVIRPYIAIGENGIDFNEQTSLPAGVVYSYGPHTEELASVEKNGEQINALHLTYTGGGDGGWYRVGVNLNNIVINAGDSIKVTYKLITNSNNAGFCSNGDGWKDSATSSNGWATLSYTSAKTYTDFSIWNYVQGTTIDWYIASIEIIRA